MQTRKARTETREALLDAATGLFLRQGFTRTSIDEVCTASGVTKGALFHYFDDKEALGRAALERWMANGERAFGTGPYLAAADPLERALGLIDFAIELSRLGPPGCLVGIFSQELAPTNETVRQSCAASFARWIDHFEGLLEAAKQAHAPGAALEPRSLAQHALAVLQGSLILARAQGSRAIIEEQLRHVRRYIEMRFEAARTSRTPRRRIARRRAARGSAH